MGPTNKVEFDAGKESIHVISKVDSSLSSFLLLGIDYNSKLTMQEAVRSCVTSASWKLTALLRTQRFYTIRDLVNLFKTHILSFIEYRTPAVLHAATSLLAPLDHIQERFLNSIGLSSFNALVSFNLTPLPTRRDITALAVIHRAILGKGPRHFHTFFQFDPAPPRQSTRFGSRNLDRQILDPYNQLHRDYINRSTLGYIWIYNRLPADITDAPSVRNFQTALQNLLKDHASRNPDNWIQLFSARQSRSTCAF